MARKGAKKFTCCREKKVKWHVRESKSLRAVEKKVKWHVRERKSLRAVEEKSVTARKRRVIRFKKGKDRRLAV